MTKTLRIVATLLIIFSLMGCGMKKNNEAENNAADTNTEPVVEDNTATDTTTDANLATESNHELAVADDVADEIVEMEEVESANVIVTDENAYVAVVLKEGTEGTEQIENTIADQTREAHTNFKNVYVSVNPDFVKQMNDYGTKIRNNEPVAGFFEEFSDAMRRVFPDAH